MYNQNSKGLSYSAGFFMLIAFTIAGIMLADAIYTPLFKAMTGKDFETIKDGVMIPAYSDAMKVVQVISAVIGFFLPAIVAAFMLSRKPFQLLGFSPQVKPEQVGVVVLLIVAALLVSFALSYFNREIPMPADWKIKADQLEKDYNSQLAGIINLESTGDYILALFIMAFLPALCEETLFRGGLQNFLTRSTGRPWVSIIIVSLIFSLVHFSYYGFLPRFFLGAVLGFIYHYSGKLWLSILAHFINNALAITVLYASIKEGKQISEIMNEDKTGGGWWGIFLLPVLVTLFAYFKKISASDKEAAV